MAEAAEADRRWMTAALSLARRGLGRVWPNPAVGCVLVRGGRLLGRGWTQPGGRPHAEAMALGALAVAGGDGGAGAAGAAAAAAGAATGATAYVSLEPCAHHGRTPPCADALIAAGITRLVAPMEDPDPRVAGRGFAALRAAGVAVETGLMADEAEAVNAGFLMRQRAGRPFVTLKLAATLDGRIATRTGESRWITGGAARARVHLMRASHDAILIGAGTARADDPMLDIRLPGLEDRRPLRLVIDPRLDLPGDSRLARSAGAAPVWRLCAEGAGTGADWGEAVPTPIATDGEGGPSRLDLPAMMRALGERGLTRVLCEGGGALAGALLSEDLVDELVWMSAGAAIGADGAPALGPLGVEVLAAAPRFRLIGSERLDDDVMTVWRQA